MQQSTVSESTPSISLAPFDQVNRGDSLSKGHVGQQEEKQQQQPVPRRPRDPQRVWGDAETARLAGIMASSSTAAADGNEGATDIDQKGVASSLKLNELNESTTTTTTASD